MTGNDTIVYFFGSVGDHRHVDQAARPASVQAATRFAASAASPQYTRKEIPFQVAEVRTVDRLIDGLVHNVSIVVIGELAA